MGLFPLWGFKSHIRPVDASPMQTLELAILNPTDVKLIVAAIAAWTVLLCLKILGHGYLTAVRCHNLKIKTHQLRIKFNSELYGPGPVSPTTASRPLPSVGETPDSLSQAA